MKRGEIRKKKNKKRPIIDLTNMICHIFPLLRPGVKTHPWAPSPYSQTMNNTGKMVGERRLTPDRQKELERKRKQE